MNKKHYFIIYKYQCQVLYTSPNNSLSHTIMASSSYNSFLFFTFLIAVISPSLAQTSFRPKALVLPVSKDAATLQYVTELQQRTPLVPVKLTVDLGGMNLWVACEQGYVSSTYKLARCGSAQCALALSKACAMPNNTCNRGVENMVTNRGTDGEVAQDVLSLQSTNGFNPGRRVTIPNFVFACVTIVNDFVMEGLASGVQGIAGLGKFKVGLPAQFAAAFSFHRKFAMCLSSSTNSPGVIFFGDGPYNMFPGIDISKSLYYTPIINNPVNTRSGFLGESSAEYFIGVKGIKINDISVKLNTSLLTIDSNGYGGTKISTVDRYTVMETSIYNAFVDAFVKAIPRAERVKAVAPFGACFRANTIGFSRMGPSAPNIDLVLQSNNVVWRMIGANSMVSVDGDVLCLGFVDGGQPRTSIVIGGHQLENNLLQFDLATSRLGFSNSLFFNRTNCANFNFTSVA